MTETLRALFHRMGETADEGKCVIRTVYGESTSNGPLLFVCKKAAYYSFNIPERLQQSNDASNPTNR